MKPVGRITETISCALSPGDLLVIYDGLHNVTVVALFLDIRAPPAASC